MYAFVYIDIFTMARLGYALLSRKILLTTLVLAYTHIVWLLYVCFLCICNYPILNSDCVSISVNGRLVVYFVQAVMQPVKHFIRVQSWYFLYETI